MIPSQVNRTLLVAALALACKPGSAAQSTGDSSLSARSDTARVATTAPATTDSSITRADLSRIQGSPNAPVWVIVVSDFGDHGAQGSVVGEKFSFAGFEFADSAVGLGELVVECAEGGSCWRHGTSS